MKFNKVALMVAWLGLSLLSGSVLLNVVLYQQLRKYYTELSQVRLDPLGLGEYESVSLGDPSSDETRVVFWGDSRAAGWPAPDIAGPQFINRGISSQTTIQTLQRFEAHVRPLQPDVVVIQVGINDLKTIPLFPGARDAIVADCFAHIEQMVAAARDLGATVIVSTIIPPGEVPLQRRPVWSDEVARAVVAVNGAIARLADEDVIVFDAYGAIADERGLMPDAYRKDELHLNERGYAVLNQAFAEELTGVLPN
ncbi:MAG: SGNH/GDSL hydrolase family protein [Elainellaceae cyanobacterium]